jgi:hypothetical protein
MKETRIEKLALALTAAGLLIIFSRRWSFGLRKARKWALDSIFLVVLFQNQVNS